MVIGTIGVLAQPEGKVEAQLYQVGDVTSFGVGGGGRHGHNGLNDAKGGSLLSFDRKVFYTVGFKLMVEASTHSGVGLGFWRISCVGKSIQEVGCQNRFSRLRNRLFPRLVQALLGAVGVRHLVSVYL